MIKKIKYTACIVVIILISCATFAFDLENTIEKQKWSYILSVGGLKIGKPYFEKDNWYLEVKCDVSGLREISAKPTAINSFHVCRDIKVEIQGENIQLTVITSFPDDVHRSALCNDAKLGKIPDGEYKVYYIYPAEEQVLIGNINIRS
jgi:hypothetical protein